MQSVPLKIRFVSFAAAAMALLGCSTGTAADKSASVKAWVFEQKQDDLGPFRVYACAQGIRAEGVKTGIVAVAHPPDWMVFGFVPAAKKFSSCKPEKFRGFSLSALTIWTRGSVPSVPVSLKQHGTAYGLKTADYESSASFAAEQARRFANNEIHPSSIKHLSFQVADALDVPTTGRQILCRVYGLPVVDGIPIDLKYDRVHTGVIPLLTTKSCQQKLVPASMFALPAGYTKAPSMESLAAQTNSGQGGIGLILKEMDSKEGFPLKNW
jgi:hypothetical protein